MLFSHTPLLLYIIVGPVRRLRAPFHPRQSIPDMFLAITTPFRFSSIIQDCARTPGGTAISMHRKTCDVYAAGDLSSPPPPPPAKEASTGQGHRASTMNWRASPSPFNTAANCACNLVSGP